MPVQQVGADEHVGARPDREAAQLVGFEGAPCEEPARRVETQRFLNHLMSECQRLGRIEAKRRPDRDGVRLRFELRRGIAVLTDEVPGPGQGSGGGFMPGDDQRHHLVDHFLVAHGSVVFAIARAYQHLEEVEAFLGLAAPALDQIADQLGERAKAEGEFQIPVLFLGHHFEGIGSQLTLEPRQVRAEDRMQHDLQGQLAEVLGEIDGLPGRGLGRPARGVFLVHFMDQSAEPVEHPAVEGRLHHAPLAAPKITFAGHDPVAEQDLHPVHALALGVVAMVRQQHPFDVAGVVDDVVVDAAARREYPVDIAVLGETPPHQSQ